MTTSLTPRAPAVKNPDPARRRASLVFRQQIRDTCPPVDPRRARSLATSDAPPPPHQSAHAYAACDVGINASANGSTLLFIGLPVMWVLNAVVFGAVLARVSGPTWRRRALGVPAALAALVFVAWLLFAWQGTPSDYPDPICPSNVPPWWPSWIPV
jgi:hypothetical protein